MRRRRRFACLLTPAVLFCSHAALAQEDTRAEPEQRPRTAQPRDAESRQAQPRSARATDRAAADRGSESGLTLQGPNGRDVLEVVKSLPDQVRAGEQFDYRITVKNVSDSPVQNVTVVEQVEGLQVREAKPTESRPGSARETDAANDNQPNRPTEQQQQQQAQQQQQQAQQQQNAVQQEGNTIRYRIGRVDAGQTRSLTVSAVAERAGEAHACLWVDYQPTLCTTINVVQPDFRLVGRLLFERGIKTDQKVDGLYRCDEVFLEMQVTSTGDAATQPAQATIDLPEGLTTADNQQQLKVDFGPLAPGRTVERKVPLKLDPQKAGDQIELPISATAGDLKAQVRLPAVKVLDPQLELTAESPEQAYINRPVEIPVTVKNPSQAPVLDAVVRVESSGDFERFTTEGAKSSNDGTIALGRIEPGQSREFTLRMEANKPTDATVNLVAEGYCVEAQRHEAKLSLKGIPAVLIEVVDKVDPVPIGQNTVYEIAIKNQGTQQDTNIQLKATLPESMEFVRGDGETKVTAEGKTINFAQLKELAPGDVVSWTVQVKANKADKARLKVEMTSDATDEPVIEQEPTTLYGDTPQQQNEGQPTPQE